MQDLSACDAEDEDDDDDAQPFADLFGRLKSTVAKPKPAPAKSPGAKSAGAKQPSGSSGAGSARPKASGRNKRVAELDVEAGTAMPTKAFRLGADNHPAPEVVLSRDDEESLAKFTEQVNSFLELRADAAEDDTAFAAWSKDKLQQISVVKNPDQ